MFFEKDTIAAIATAPGEGGVAIVKISGSSARAIVSSLCLDSQGQSSTLESKSINLVGVYTVETRALIDEAILLWMPGPASYTREDVAEIQCHGGRTAAASILAAVLTLGARLAEPGEFTLRAYLNGRVDLLQAEAVLDVINASTSKSLEVHEQILKGGLSAEVKRWSAMIVRSLMFVEAILDFSEEEDIQLDSAESLETLRETIGAIENKLQSYKWGNSNRDGLNVVLTGSPNTGKSSLLNRFAGEDRVIVSPIPGTTRDTVDVWVNANGVPVRFFDTAGIRDSGDAIEMEGVSRARRAISFANVVLFIVDGGRFLSNEESLEAVSLSKKYNVLPVINKIDLGDEPAGCLLNVFGVAPHRVSALTGEGINELLIAISAQAASSSSLGVQAPLTRIRHKECLESALNCLNRAKKILETNSYPEVAASEMHAARRLLGELVGEGAPEDVINAIFSEFCVGK